MADKVTQSGLQIGQFNMFPRYKARPASDAKKPAVRTGRVLCSASAVYASSPV